MSLYGMSRETLTPFYYDLSIVFGGYDQQLTGMELVVVIPDILLVIASAYWLWMLFRRGRREKTG